VTAADVSQSQLGRAELEALLQTTQAELDGMAAELLDKYEELTLLYDLNSAFRSVFDVPALCEIALAKSGQVIPSIDLGMVSW